MNVAYQHVHSRVPAPSSVIRGIPTEIDELVVAATDSDPTGRPADAATFLAEIAEIRSELALPVMPIPPRPRPDVRPSGLPPTAIDAGAPMVHPYGPASDTGRTDVLAGGTGAYATQVVPRGYGPGSQRVGPHSAAERIRPGKPPKPPLSAKARRRRRGMIGLAIVLLLGLLALFGGMQAVDWYRNYNAHVPKLANDSQSVAFAKLRHDGYKPVLGVPQFSETVGAGDVISTDPAGGSRLSKGKQVTLVLSRGKDRVDVPSVANLSLADAQSALQAKGLQFSSANKTSLTVPAGNVIGTSPPANTPVKPHSAIVILVSTGPPITQIPSIAQGTPFGDAQTTLKQAGFKVKRNDVFNDTVPAGQVVDINPSDQAPQGSTVTVDVSKGPQFVTIPNFAFGDRLTNVEAQLTQLGLKFTVQEYPGGGNGKTFLSCNPGPGQQAQVGSTVTITAF
jgi:serine/threonine-protein kinase